MIPLLAIIVTQCAPAAPEALVEVSLKKGSHVKDVVALLSRSTCHEYDLGPGLGEAPVSLVVSGTVPAAALDELATAVLRSGGVTINRQRQLRKWLPACDPTVASAELSRLKKTDSCSLNLTAFGRPESVMGCVDVSVKLSEAGDGGVELRVDSVGELLQAVGLEAGDRILSLPSSPVTPFTLSLVRAGKPRTLSCEVVGDVATSPLHPMRLLQAGIDRQASCVIPEDAFLTKESVVEVDTTRAPRFTWECLMRTARVVPAFRSGERTGLKLFSIRPGSVLANVGLKNGDELRTINGEAVGTSPEELFVRLRKERRFVLEFQRNGEAMTRTIQLKR